MNQEEYFQELCRSVSDNFFEEWENASHMQDQSQKIKKAIIGYQDEVEEFIQKIRSFLVQNKCEDVWYPACYESLEWAVYHENWGLSGMAEWFSESYRESSSAKIIGDRIYFLDDGQMKLMPQKISRERREQLVRALLLLTPEERLDKEFHEIYMLDGTRITIFSGGMTKPDQDVIIFRRYIIPTYTFEEQAERGTIPAEAVPLFKEWVKLGYNVVFTGAIRSSKTTFLATWQSYEDPSLEGVMLETDPEIPIHKLIPEAPVVQLIADNEKLAGISKNLLRSDADYFILGEARDGIALDTAVRIAGKGTRRMKMTFHIREPLDFPNDAAWEISRSVGGDMKTMALRVAGAFDYIFHFIQLKDKSRKRLNAIYEMSCDRVTGEISMVRICSYDLDRDTWRWNYYIGEEKQMLGEDEDLIAFKAFDQLLKELDEQSEEVV
ncbi:ATPase [Sinanaerobacter chloroacetimidivorans]|uniref:ATPase n=1 Tax=Sinanaerobacter chloroacetimidivorans TaxID=2818044 RepID=A0A8J7W1Z6_9FIRM|nr:ATPase [Sinanaerobacter chloroacetimidivorans]MBR0597663.1 ATPase [Sinanaerobacter chloroacetimidivorans]